MALTISCSESPRNITQQLAEIDSLLNDSPTAALDSLSALDAKAMDSQSNAYYCLLLTIAQHKNHIPFENDSLISLSRKWYESHDDYYSYARALLYNGVVLYYTSRRDTMGIHFLKAAEEVIDRHSVDDARLNALLFAYLGKLQFLDDNYERAAFYFGKAVQAEDRLKNYRNLILDYCDLLVCLTKAGDTLQAKRVYDALNNTVASHPGIRTDYPDNAKAIYFLHCTSELDSALFYSERWKPSGSDIGAKSKLLATIHRKKGNLVEAVSLEKAAFEHRREADSLYYHVYYRNLADLYSQLGEADSTARYAQLAYEALHESVTKKTEKRVLELEKQYDLAAKEAELERMRHHRGLMAVSLAALLLLAGGLVLLLRNREQKLRAERITRSFVQAAARTHQFTLSSLKPLTAPRKSATVEGLKREIGNLATTLRKGFTDNFAAAIESSQDALTPRQRADMQKLSGERAKTVYILTELGYDEDAIAEYTCTSADSVRVTINNNKRVLSSREAAET